MNPMTALRWESGSRLTERILNNDPEIPLAWVQVFREQSRAFGFLCRGDDYTFVEVYGAAACVRHCTARVMPV